MIKAVTSGLHLLSISNKEISKQKEKNLLSRIQIFHVSAALTRYICQIFVFVRTEYGIKWYEDEYKWPRQASCSKISTRYFTRYRYR